jgi:hypothetical protein
MSLRDHLPEGSGSLSRRQLRALFFVGLVLGSVVFPQVVSALAAYLSNSGQNSGGVTYRAPDGPAANLTGTKQVNMTNPFPDNQTVDLRTDAGNITLSSPGRTNVTINEINGTWTNVSSLDVTGANLTINPDDKQRIVVGGDADTLRYRETMQVGDGETDFIYGGASGTTTLKLYGLPADTYLGFYEPATGDVLAGGQTNSDGVLVVEDAPNSEHTVELVESDGDPTFDDDSAKPTGTQSGDVSELAINVTDADFPEDTVNVTFFLSGEKVGTDTLEDAGRANVTLSNSVDSGQWYAVAEDKYGQTTESLTYEFKGPDKVYFYNESNPSELLDNTTIEATIYQGDNVYNRTTNDGTFNLSGLPSDEELVMVAEADGYYTRHIIIDSIAEQQDVYLLPDTNVSSVEVRFKIEDKTGAFDAETTDVIVKKPITRNGDTTYETVAADQAGVAGFTTYLEEDVRYRLVVRNDDGDSRVLGTYTASVSETVTLTIGQLEFGAGGGDDAYQWDAAHENKSTGEAVKFEFNDPVNESKDLDLRIYERGNESNVIHDGNYDGPFGELAVTETVPSEFQGATWVVEWSAQYQDERITGKAVVGPNAGDFGMPLDSTWKHVASVGIIIVAAGFFGGVQSTLGVGAIAVLGGFFWWIRWLPEGIGAGAVVLALAVAAFAAARTGGGA